MPDRFVRTLRAAGVIALVPPAVLAWAGGADLDLPGGARVSWFHPAAATIALAVALAGAAWGPGRSPLRRALALLSLVACAATAVVLWTGGIHTPWLRSTDPLRPALAAAALLAASALRRGGGPALRTRGLGVPLASVAAGLALLGAGVAWDRAVLARHLPAAGGGGAAGGHDAIVILVDTLRADALGLYGARPSPSPFVDELGGHSSVFSSAFAQAPWTFPAVASLMTARHPTSMALPARIEPDGDTLPALPPDAPRLATWLSARGWHTVAFYKNPMIGPGSGFEAGFDLFDFVGGDKAEGRSAGQLVDAALGWARAFAARRAEGATPPFFLYLHFMDPHADYQPPRAFLPPEALAYDGPIDGSAQTLARLVRRGAPLAEEDLAQLRRLYRAEVAYLDTELRRLHEGLARLGLWKAETCVVLTADHGEQFGEHGEFSHGDVHVENVHVPLLFHGCGAPARAIPEVVRQIDIAPTLLELLGAPPLPGAEGRSVVPRLRGASLPALPAITEHGERARVTTDAHALVREAHGAELFDRAADPGERVDVAPRLPDETRALRDTLERHRARSGGAPPARAVERPVDPSVREQLRALGYL